MLSCCSVGCVLYVFVITYIPSSFPFCFFFLFLYYFILQLYYFNAQYNQPNLLLGDSSLNILPVLFLFPIDNLVSCASLLKLPFLVPAICLIFYTQDATNEVLSAILASLLTFLSCKQPLLYTLHVTLAVEQFPMSL